MKIHLYRTFIHGGVVGQLYAENELVCYSLDIAGKNARSFIAGLPDGKFLIRRPQKPASEWQLQITLPGSRKQLQLCLQDALLPETLAGCEDPLCLLGTDGKVRLSEPAMDRLLRLFKPIWAGEEKAWLVVESAGRRNVR